MLSIQQPRRVYRLRWLLPALLLGATIYVAQPKRDELIPYTTPALYPTGARVQLLIPSGWGPAANDYPAPLLKPRRSALSWWLNRYFLRKPDRDPWIEIVWSKTGFSGTNDAAVRGSDGTVYAVTYADEGNAEALRLRGAILRSLRVLEPPGPRP